MLNDLAALYSASPVLFAGSVFVIGLVVGSFLNVVIYRLPIILEREWHAQAAELLPSDDHTATVPAVPPERFSLSVPRSACPACKAPITALQNIPVISWLVLRGRCASCKAKISARYPVVELATGLLSAWVGGQAHLQAYGSESPSFATRTIATMNGMVPGEGSA